MRQEPGGGGGAERARATLLRQCGQARPPYSGGDTGCGAATRLRRGGGASGEGAAPAGSPCMVRVAAAGPPPAAPAPQSRRGPAGAALRGAGGGRVAGAAGGAAPGAEDGL